MSQPDQSALLVLFALDVLLLGATVLAYWLLRRRLVRKAWEGLRAEPIEAVVIGFEKEDEPVEGPAVEFPILEYEAAQRRRRVVARMSTWPRRDEVGDRVLIHLHADDPERFADTRDVHIDRGEYVLLVPFVFVTLACWAFTIAGLVMGF